MSHYFIVMLSVVTLIVVMLSVMAHNDTQRNGKSSATNSKAVNMPFC
jgi:hypothetical protein